MHELTRLSVDPDLLDDRTLAIFSKLRSLKSLNCAYLNDDATSVDCIDLGESNVSRRGVSSVTGFREADSFVIPAELVTDELLEGLLSSPRFDSLNCDYDCEVIPDGSTGGSSAVCLKRSCVNLAGTKVTIQGLKRAASRGFATLVPPRGLRLDAVGRAPTKLVELSKGGVVKLSGAGPGCAFIEGDRIACWNPCRDQASSKRGGLCELHPVEPRGRNGMKQRAGSCALFDDGRVMCEERLRGRELRALVGGLEDAVSIVGRGASHCVLRKNGRVACWGANYAGQLGDGTTKSRDIPADIEGLTDVVSLGMSSANGCAINRAGKVHCWGVNSTGLLGTGESGRHPSLRPKLIEGVSDATEVALVHTSACVLQKNGSVVCWGTNNLGRAAEKGHWYAQPPRQVPGITGAKRLFVLGGGNCVIAGDDRLWCWGGPFTKGEPAPMTQFGDAVEIASQPTKGVCIRTTTGRVLCTCLSDVCREQLLFAE